MTKVAGSKEIVKYIYLDNTNMDEKNTLCQIKINKCVQGNGSENLGRVGTHIYFIIFSWKKNNFMHFERHLAFQNA